MRHIFLAIILFLSYRNVSSQVISIDVLIKNGVVFDGTANDSVRVDIGIKGDKIVYIGKGKSKEIKAARTIDASGLWVAPGFIDPHTHAESDLSSNKKNSNLPYLTQGVTTVLAGNDGTSPFPIGTKLAKWEQQGTGTNVGLFIGHATVRRLVLGDQNIAPNEVQLNEMKLLVDSAMRDGAFGLSSGLFYAPGAYAETSEVIELAKIAAKYKGIYDTHIRDESSYTIGLERSIQEAIEIGRQSGIPIHISHIKALGVDVWGKSKDIVSMIERAHAAGIDVTANQYPYHASRTSLVAALIPRWAEGMGTKQMIEVISTATPGDSITRSIAENIRRRGGAKTLQISGSSNDSLEQKTLEDIALMWHMAPEEAAIRLIQRDANLRVVSFNMSEKDLEYFTRQPWVMTASDGTPGHPRKFGSFVKRLKDFALDTKTVSPSFIIHASSGLTAETLGIRNRGFIREGYYADIIVFDPKTLDTKATFENPDVLAEGVIFVFVNGVLAIDSRGYTGKLSGRSLKH